MIDKFYKFFSNDIGIDLGTSNTLVYLHGQGIIISEPSVVSINKKTGRIVAIGTDAKNMIGRTPSHIETIRPLVDGVISDFEITEEMLSYLINKVKKISNKIMRPRVLVGVPSGITNVEVRAVIDATKSAGAREVLIVEEPIAAAIGIRLPVKNPVGSMIIDIGGGTTDIAVISLGGIVSSRNIKVAGDKLNEDIINYIKDEFKILIGERTAEDVKIDIGNINEDLPIETTIKGRDLITGLPREVTITDSDIREAISRSVEQLTIATKEVLEEVPPEIISDVMHRGIALVGGGALLKGLAELLHEELGIPVYIADEPLTAVARGTGIILENMNSFKDMLLNNTDDISITKN